MRALTLLAITTSAAASLGVAVVAQCPLTVSGSFPASYVRCALPLATADGSPPNRFLMSGRLLPVGTGDDLFVYDRVTDQVTQLGTNTGAAIGALAELPNGDLIAGGTAWVGGTSLLEARLLRYTTNAWQPIVNLASPGLATGISALLVLPNGDLLVGGSFLPYGLARWDGATWSTFGGGATRSVVAMVADPDGSIVVGGVFVGGGGVPGNAVQRWTSNGWQPLGAGIGGNGITDMVQMPDGDLVIIGDFLTAGGVPVQRVARWNGTAWSAMGVAPQFPTNLTVLPNGDPVLGGSDLVGSGLVPRLLRFAGGAWVDLLATPAVASQYVNWLPGRLVVADPATALQVIGTSCPAAVAAFGAPCSVGGQAHTLWATAQPWAGGTFSARGEGGGDWAVVVYGFAPLALPLASVLPQALPGCNLYVSPDLIELHPTPSGSLTTRLDLPNDPSLAGTSVGEAAVGFVLDPLLGLSSVTGSNALAIQIGAF